MRGRFCTLPTILMLAATVVHAHPSGYVTWGKPGVTLDQYARDATECADTSYTTPVFLRPETVRQLDALSTAQIMHMMTSFDMMGSQGSATAYFTSWHEFGSENDIARRSNTFGAHYVTTARFDVVGELQAALDRCLAGRGYVRLRLSDAQAERLSRLHRHTAERTRYLHSLGSDAEIVARQRLVLTSAP
ncbi:hypothetical protein [Sphingomonas nostoxanthinifaciens]|uniref:hypothetical protein n=1 Tax=Sphingomonas nostoxanthinifaciens TaxID=2872652 RepID=UPI001CC1E4A0|nr:hypothetical protein [Sphingomonas nostoxanthinifaciens]UAK23961.1 hypothetical protein K8P63_16615 [Sphingomonas nostoxanthinifaciens]